MVPSNIHAEMQKYAVNTFLYGIVFTQGVTYYTSSGYKRDSWIVK